MTDGGVDGRVIIVTGAGRGIGRGLARHLARRGAHVVAAERRTDLLAETMDELGAIGPAALGVGCDVGVHESIDAMVGATLDRFGRVDALVNNAQSFRPVTPLEDVTEADMDRLWRTGPLGTLWGMQAVFGPMRDAGWGRIVNVASVNGLRGAAGYGPYNAAKEAIRALTRTAAREWAVHGIVVNCYCPASTAHLTPPPVGDPRRASWDALYNEHPMGRDGDAEHDVGPAVAFLCSDACRWMTGETLMLDGGGFLRP